MIKCKGTIKALSTLRDLRFDFSYIVFRKLLEGLLWQKEGTNQKEANISPNYKWCREGEWWREARRFQLGTGEKERRFKQVDRAGPSAAVQVCAGEPTGAPPGRSAGLKRSLCTAHKVRCSDRGLSTSRFHISIWHPWKKAAGEEGGRSGTDSLFGTLKGLEKLLISSMDHLEKISQSY